LPKSWPPESHADEEVIHVAKVIAVVVAAIVAAGGVVALPDIKRYLKMRKM
jgi:hypothetical protein